MRQQGPDCPNFGGCTADPIRWYSCSPGTTNSPRPGGDRHYLYLTTRSIYDRAAGTLAGEFPAGSDAVDGFAFNELKPISWDHPATASDNTYLLDCAGDNGKTDAWTFVDSVLKKVHDAYPGTLIVYVADPQNDQAVDVNGNWITAWAGGESYRLCIQNVMYYAQAAGLMPDLVLAFECYQGGSARQLATYINSLNGAYGATMDNLGIVFPPGQNSGGQLWQSALDYIGATTPATRPRWVFAYAFGGSSAESQQTRVSPPSFNNAIASWT